MSSRQHHSRPYNNNNNNNSNNHRNQHHRQQHVHQKTTTTSTATTSTTTPTVSKLAPTTAATATTTIPPKPPMRPPPTTQQQSQNQTKAATTNSQLDSTRVLPLSTSHSNVSMILQHRFHKLHSIILKLNTPEMRAFTHHLKLTQGLCTPSSTDGHNNGIITDDTLLKNYHEEYKLLLRKAQTLIALIKNEIKILSLKQQSRLNELTTSRLTLYCQSQHETKMLKDECTELEDVLQKEIVKKTERLKIAHHVNTALNGPQATIVYMSKQRRQVEINRKLSVIGELLLTEQRKRDSYAILQKQLLTLLAVSEATMATIDNNDETSNNSNDSNKGKDGNDSKKNTVGNNIAKDDKNRNDNTSSNEGNNDYILDLLAQNITKTSQLLAPSELLTIVTPLLQQQKQRGREEKEKRAQQQLLLQQRQEQALVQQQQQLLQHPRGPTKRGLRDDGMGNVNTIVKKNTITPLDPTTLSTEDF